MKKANTSREIPVDTASEVDQSLEKTAPTRGRPRSEAAAASVLNAAYACAAQEDARNVTIEAIAKASGVSKVTIYRWWEDKQALLTDAFLWHIQRQVPLSESGDPIRAIHRHAVLYLSQLNGEMGRVLRVVLAECLTKSGDTSVFCERYLNHRRELGGRVIAAGQRSGAIPSKRSPFLLYDQIYGTIFYRFVFGFPGLNTRFLRELIEHTFHGP
ncbi:TetR/AcrR family transcriptional regulator [Burkholderia sp. 9120]|uniref:TetR/AcrR family transcriptional regulator n=1 Tax=Burkholderia sp. 9120 TaxID=1500897 RepID=UPI000691E905|nr:TetR/AcrR family transcriptional regulator [Burkholderia sp. 9120]